MIIYCLVKPLFHDARYKEQTLISVKAEAQTGAPWVREWGGNKKLIKSRGIVEMTDEHTNQWNGTAQQSQKKGMTQQNEYHNAQDNKRDIVKMTD